MSNHRDSPDVALTCPALSDKPVCVYDTETRYSLTGKPRALPHRLTLGPTPRPVPQPAEDRQLLPAHGAISRGRRDLPQRSPDR